VRLREAVDILQQPIIILGRCWSCLQQPLRGAIKLLVATPTMAINISRFMELGELLHHDGIQLKP